MKRFLFFFFLSVFFASCGEPDYSAVEDGGLSLGLTSETEGLTSEADIENNPHREPIQIVMENYERLAGEELGGKDRALIDLSETVGDNALSEHHPEGEIGTAFTVVTAGGAAAPADQGSSEGSSSGSEESSRNKEVTPVELRITDTENPVEPPPPQQPGETPPIDLLFYVQDRRDSCVAKFRQAFVQNNWFEQLNTLEWQAAFSFFSEGPVDLLPLEAENGVPYNTIKDRSAAFNQQWDYILTKGEYGSSHGAPSMFDATLQPLTTQDHARAFNEWRSVYIDNNRRNNALSGTAYHKLNSNGRVQNPLGGLSNLLDPTTGLKREGSFAIVFMFGNDFPYYEPDVWQDFYNKHQDLKLYVIADRTDNLSNLHFILSDDRFHFVECNSLISQEHFISAH